ncbi:DEAD/DEAH box helicase [Arthrobacter sp. 2YAF22_2]|uniref:DEAD/DEAH box helicase n=1 Tax=Arthrobacter sp. 2YAF22_2 TaxID=3233029 RepID=UPI003F92A4C0
MLKLQLALDPGRVQLACDDEQIEELRKIATRLVTATYVRPRVIEVDLDDLLVNVAEIANWPRDDEVLWSDELGSIIRDNFSDAEAMRSRLTTDEIDGESQMLSGGWLDELRSFQKRDVSKLLSLKHGANFSVPGAGKTRATLALLMNRMAQGSADRLLVISPKSAFEAWSDEVRVTLGQGDFTPIIVTTNEELSGLVVLVNYERLAIMMPHLIRWMRLGKTMLVLDEAHRMKLGMRGQWGSACMQLAPFASHRLILSGTPAPNGSADLESLFSFVWPGQGTRHVRSAISTGSLKSASAALRPLFTRTTKTELDLPPMKPKVRRVELPPLHREIYDALVWRESVRLRRDGRNLADLGKVILYLIMAATSPALVAVGASRHEPLAYRVPPLELPLDRDGRTMLEDLPNFELSPKYVEVAKIVQKNWQEGRKTLVWSTFVRNLTTLERILEPFNPAMVHGGTEDRSDQIEKFRTDPTCAVLLSNPATLGEGISFHHTCHDAVYVDRDFSAGRYLQSVDRIHRLGLAPHTRTNVTILVAANTIDELVEVRLQQKLDFMGGILDDGNIMVLGDLDEEVSESAGLDARDVEELLNHLKP